MNACQQVIARKGRPIVICSKGDDETKKLGYCSLEIPHVPDCLAGVLTVIPLQLLSFHLAVLRGYDVSSCFFLKLSFVIKMQLCFRGNVNAKLRVILLETKNNLMI